MTPSQSPSQSPSGSPSVTTTISPSGSSSVTTTITASATLSVTTTVTTTVTSTQSPTTSPKYLGPLTYKPDPWPSNTPIPTIIHIITSTQTPVFVVNYSDDFGIVYTEYSSSSTSSHVDVLFSWPTTLIMGFVGATGVGCMIFVGVALGFNVSSKKQPANLEACLETTDMSSAAVDNPLFSIPLTEMDNPLNNV